VAVAAPKIDERTAKEVQELCVVLADMPVPFDPHKGVSAALIGAFSRLAELIIERLNSVPDKNFLAFLDLLGASPLAPRPARVPLTFSLAGASTVDGVIPAGTQAAAPPAEGEKEPTIFETERELVVTAARLTGIFVRDPTQDTYADYSSIINAEASVPVPIFQGDQRIEHILYLSHDRLFSYPGLKELRLSLTLESERAPAPTNVEREAEPQPVTVQWEFWDGTQWAPRPPEADARSLEPTDKVAPVSVLRAGEVRFTDPLPFVRQTVMGLEKYWLRCRLMTPLTPPAQGRLPVIQRIGIQAFAGRSNLQIEKAFLNDTALDLSKDFFPFGEKPRFGETLALMTSEAFAEPGSSIKLHVKLVNPTEPDTGRAVDAAMAAARSAQKAAEIASMAARENQRAVSPTPPVVTLIEASLQMSGKATDLAAGATGTAQAAQKMATSRERLAQAQKAVKLADDAVQAAQASAQASVFVSVNMRTAIEAQTATAEARRSVEVATREMTAIKEAAAPPIPPTRASADLKLKWELSSGSAWIELGTTTRDGVSGSFSDGTKAFTQSGDVSFTLPDQPARTTIGGVEGYWIRVRIVSGNYGEETHFQLKDPNDPAQGYQLNDPTDRAKGYVLVPASFAPPSISSITVDYNLTSGKEQPESVLTYNDFVYGDVTGSQSFAPFQATEEEHPTLSLCFTLPAQRSAFPNRTISLYTSVAEIKYGEIPFKTGVAAQEEVAASDPASGRLHLAWTYWNGKTWGKLVVSDESVSFTLPGLIEFLGPSDMTRRRDFGIDAYWVRVEWQSGQYEVIPRLKRLLLNTTIAAQTVTIDNEILGSSDGRINQKFRTTRAPVLPGQRLAVREQEMPSPAEEKKIISEEGADAINVVADSAGRPREIWVRWHEVPDFYGSEARDRHYKLDHLTGEVRFGDGLRGLIPPISTGNILVTRYQTGGGASGNRPAGTITQLKTTVPYVDKVTNVEAAAGGADAETTSSLIARAPQTLRHQYRAVTLEDYQDLAILASPGVARAKCVPLYDLAADPDATHQKPGTVSLVIVPRLRDPKPLPSLELIDAVRDYINERRLPVGKLVIVGPEFVRVDVEAVISLTSLDIGTEVEANVLLALSRYLHPLTGGLDGTGWDFGRKPYKSDLYALLEAIDGVDHINLLDVVETEDREGISQTGRFLVYSGFHKISLTFEAG
jgi:hypothetical protein